MPVYTTTSIENHKEYGKVFIKSGTPGDVYRCEANGLKELAKAGVIRIPKVFQTGDDHLITEYIPSGNKGRGFFATFGRQLALLHRYCSDRFGFFEDNYIGANPQPNIPRAREAFEWTTFYFNKRLLFQYHLAEKNYYITSSLKSGFLKLEKNIDKLLAGSEEPPSLLHGDLWGGNYLCDENAIAVLIDPAVYYGHREADLAMTKLFGGFSPDFYEAYQLEYPLLPGWEQREPIYRLYHVLNHLNLFGTAYLSEAESLLNLLCRNF